MHLRDMSRKDISTSYLKYLYEKGLSGRPIDLFGPRMLIEFGAQIDLSQLNVEQYSRNSEFESCVANFDINVFDCLAYLEGKTEDELFEPLMSLMDLKYLVDVYPLEPREEIARKLIERVLKRVCLYRSRMKSQEFCFHTKVDHSKVCRMKHWRSFIIYLIKLINTCGGLFLKKLPQHQM